MQCMRDGRMDVAQVHAEVVLRQRMELARTHRVLASVERLYDDMQRAFRALPADAAASTTKQSTDASPLVERMAAVQADVQLLASTGSTTEVLADEANQLIEQLLAEIRLQMTPERRTNGVKDETTPTRQQDELIRRLKDLRRP